MIIAAATITTAATIVVVIIIFFVVFFNYYFHIFTVLPFVPQGWYPANDMCPSCCPSHSFPDVFI
jgi:hypothetical protein